MRQAGHGPALAGYSAFVQAWLRSMTGKPAATQGAALLAVYSRERWHSDERREGAG